MYKEERGVLEKMREIDECDVEKFSTSYTGYSRENDRYPRIDGDHKRPSRRAIR